MYILGYSFALWPLTSSGGSNPNKTGGLQCPQRAQTQAVMVLGLDGLTVGL